MMNVLSQNNANNNNPRYDDDDDDMIDSLMGTWSFVKTMTASHYYQVKSFFVIHFMPDPLRQLGCQVDGCDELQNQICQEANTCVDTESNIVEWSDVSMLMQFGWEVNTGYVWESTIAQNTSDWLGPYNMLMVKQQRKEKDNSTSTSYTSRYVETAGTSYMQYPPDCSIVSQKLFDPYAGLTAVQSTISKQMNLHDDNINYDPYQNYTCPSGTNNNNNNNNKNDQGEVQWSPLLPRIEIFAPQKKKKTKTTKKTMNLKLNFDLFAFPESPKTDPLYKIWPKLLTHLDETDIHGPYCWDHHQNDDRVDVDLTSKTAIRKKKKDDGFHGYALPLVFDTRFSNNTWTIHKGCVDGLPCWHHGDHNGNRTIPKDNGNDSKTPEWERLLLTYGVYFLILAFLISLTCNCQLCMKLKRMRRRQRDPPNNANEAVVTSSRVDVDTTVPTAEEALREPLLAGASPPQSQEQSQEMAAPASAT